MKAVEQAKKQAEMEAEKTKQRAKEQVDLMMKQAQVSPLTAYRVLNQREKRSI